MERLSYAPKIFNMFIQLQEYNRGQVRYKIRALPNDYGVIRDFCFAGDAALITDILHHVRLH